MVNCVGSRGQYRSLIDQNTSIPSITPKIRITRKIAKKIKNKTFAMVRAPAAMSVKPRKPATSETIKKMTAI